MDLLTRADLELLAQRGGPEPYLSLVHTDRAAVVRLGDDEAFGHCELLDRVASGHPVRPGTRLRCARRGGTWSWWRRRGDLPRPRGAAAARAGMEEAC